METYGRILLVAMPIFLLLVLFEKWWGWKKGFDTVRHNDMISSLSSGLTNVTQDVLGLSVAIISYPWLKTQVALFDIQSEWIIYVLAFLALDFAGYWTHRLQHKVNLFWNAHIVHHSSEEYNLACALRQSISSLVRVFAIFLLPAAVLGLPHMIINVVAPLHLFAQFWYHTRHINKMGFLEHIIVTPSHHRVHHAINSEYIDKNFSQIFIFWDKLFGTFQPELSHVPPVYGVTRPVHTWNPIRINFIHLWLLVKDAWHANRLWDKLRIWFMPLGWRPPNASNTRPVHKITDVYHFTKYNKGNDKLTVRWSWIQMIVVMIFTFYLFANIASIGSPGIYYYGFFLFFSIYSFTELMDGSPSAPYLEVVKNIVGVFLLQYSGGWFGLNLYGNVFIYLIGSYFIASSIFSFYVSQRQKQIDLSHPVKGN